MVNDYSETSIKMTVIQADALLQKAWDEAWEATRGERSELSRKHDDSTGIDTGIARVAAVMLNAFEDRLREEWGLKNGGTSEG